MNRSTPVSVPPGARKSSRGDDAATPALELVGTTWQVRGHDEVRHVLRSGVVVQAGFAAETVHGRSSRPARRRARRPWRRPTEPAQAATGPTRASTGRATPVLYAHGEEHRAQRRAIARYFTPAAVRTTYRGLMEERADDLVAQIASGGRVDLAAVTMRYSVEVASRVVGLTESDVAGMTRRLSRFFEVTPPLPVDTGERRSRLASWMAVLRGTRMTLPLVAFDRHDVRPAVTARRARPQTDVISHLLASGYSDAEILTECITYAAAGMVTTREFISMAAWHLLTHEPVRRDYLAADETGRHRILHEILRLEPVVGHLYRRANAPLEFDDGTVVPAGALLDLHVRGANADEGAVGPDPLSLCPHRSTAPGVRDEALAFGDGSHRCPGNALAIAESDVFLTRLLALPVRLVSAPRLEWDELISGYVVRDIELEAG